MILSDICTLDYETEKIEDRPRHPPKPVGAAIILPGKRPKYYAWGHPTENNCTKGDFKKVLKQFPKSEEARKSLFEIANLYQGRVLKNISSEESLKNAIKYYKEIFDIFPDSKDASKALFMAGFTAANDLKNYDEAKKLYNLYLEKFPNGELVTDAKIELSNLGKSPEEILKGKIKENKNE